MSTKPTLSRITDVAILAAFLAITLVIFAFLLKIFIHDRFVRGTIIGNIDVSRETTSGAGNIIKDAIEEYSKMPLKIKLDDTIKEESLADLGIKFLPDETIKKAAGINEGKTTIRNYIFPPEEKTEIPLLISIDEKTLLDKLNKDFGMEAFKAENARLAFVDNKGKLQVVDGKDGMEIDKTELNKSIKNALGALEGRTINIRAVPKAPTLSKEDVEAQKSDIAQALKQKTIFSHPIYGNKWSLVLGDHPDWVKFALKQRILFEPTKTIVLSDKFPTLEIPGLKIQPYLAIEIDQEKFNGFIDEKMAKYLDAPTEDVNIYTDKNEKIIIEGRGDNGSQIQRDLLKKSLELALADKITTVPVPVLETEPKITVSENLQRLGIKEKLGIGYTTFYGSPGNRTYNIGIGSKKLNGTLINPDEIFSFNKTIGEVDGRTGYAKELVIKPEGTIPEFGGGLCQVSTTTYRAAIFSGLPIEERHQHSYAVTYYSQVLGHGLDATVYGGGPNLKFKNDTGNSILIQAYVKNKYELYVIFYGTSDGRTVEMDGPYISNRTGPKGVVYEESADISPGAQKKVEQAHAGFDALWYRYLTNAKGETKKEEIFSKYKATGTKILVAPGEGPAGATTPAGAP